MHSQPESIQVTRHAHVPSGLDSMLLVVLLPAALFLVKWSNGAMNCNGKFAINGHKMGIKWKIMEDNGR